MSHLHPVPSPAEGGRPVPGTPGAAPPQTAQPQAIQPQPIGVACSGTGPQTAYARLMPPGEDDAEQAVPGAFRDAVASLYDRLTRPEVVIEEMPPPRRLAPYAAALEASVIGDNDVLADGKLLVLYDPEGTRAWPGPFRVVIYVNAELDPEIADDPLIGSVSWSWLGEALDEHGATHHSISGTVTRNITEGFGEKADRPTSTELEMRASWTPEGGDLAGHAAAWCDVLCSVAGLPPVPPGVATLPPPRRGRGGGGPAD